MNVVSTLQTIIFTWLGMDGLILLVCWLGATLIRTKWPHWWAAHICAPAPVWVKQAERREQQWRNRGGNLR